MSNPKYNLEDIEAAKKLLQSKKSLINKQISRLNLEIKKAKNYKNEDYYNKCRELADVILNDRMSIVEASKHFDICISTVRDRVRRFCRDADWDFFMDDLVQRYGYDMGMQCLQAYKERFLKPRTETHQQNRPS